MARSVTIPAPTRGINARDAIEDMNAADAVSLVNWFPDGNIMRLRKGFKEHGTGIGSSLVLTLAEFSGSDGTKKLLACGSGKIFDATAAGAAIELATGLSNNKWSWQNFGGKLVMVNGVDTPKQYDGAAVTDATYTGITTPTALQTVSAYKSRLYFTQKNTAKIWYGGVNYITGELTEFNISSLLKLGGSLLFAGSFSRDSGSGLTDYFIAASNMGEVLVWSGSWPGDTTSWELSGRFFLPPFLGNRALVNLGADLGLLTLDGAYPLSTVFSSNGRVSDSSMLTNRINDEYRNAATRYGNSDGWEVITYPKGHYILINVPVTPGSYYEQLVMNTQSGAWTKFTGMNAVTWGRLGEDIYFGGVDGTIYKADVGGNDNGAAITTKLSTAYNYCGEKSKNKLFSLVKPLIKANTALDFVLGVDCDFAKEKLTGTVQTTGALGYPWGSPWGTPWGAEANQIIDDWYSVGGVGCSGSIQMNGDFKDCEILLSSFQLTYESGGIM